VSLDSHGRRFLNWEMIKSRWTAIKSGFFEVAAVPPADREFYLSSLESAVAEEIRELLDDNVTPVPDLRHPCWLPVADPEQERIFVNGRLLLRRFEVAGFLGAGGIGEVYRAFDVQQRVFVAIKVLRPAFLSDKATVALLRRELNTARVVTHRNVCRLYDVHWVPDDETPPFFSMELLEGETLASRLARLGPLSQQLAREVASQLLEGLSAAHECGVVHRDLKSGNMMLTGPEPRVAITDFGLARDVKTVGDMHTSLANGFAGTPAYMAPEQIRGERATFSSDIHAAGVVLFEMVTGRRPFEGATPVEVAARRLNERAPSPRQYASDMDRGWEYAILRCLEFDPGSRPPSVKALRELLGKRPPLHFLHRRAFIGAGIVASAGVAAAAVQFGSGLFPSRTESMPTADSAAFDFYLSGAKLMEDWSPESAREAIRNFESALKRDPSFALAMCAAADASLLLKNADVKRAAEYLATARRHATEAVRVQPGLAEAHCSLAAVEQASWQWAGAERSYLEAIRLKPSYAKAHRWYGGLILQSGHFDEALAHARRAMELDPHDRTMPGNYGLYLFLAGRNAEALAVLEPAVRDLEAIGVRFNLTQVYARLGSITPGAASHNWFTRALEQAAIIDRIEIRKRAEAGAEALPSRADQMFALIYSLTHEFDKAGPYLARLVEDLRERRIPAITVAWVYAVQRRTTEAILVLDQAVAERDPGLLYTKVVPFLENLRELPEFRRLLAIMNL
jgi:Tfp pilus assembly protein PilF